MVTSIANHYSKPLEVLRTDPVMILKSAQMSLQNKKLNDDINDQLRDIIRVTKDEKELGYKLVDFFAINQITDPHPEESKYTRIQYL